MIGYALTFRGPDDPDARAEMQTAALGVAQHFVRMSPSFLERMMASQTGAVAEAVRDLLAHWPPGPDRPEPIARLDTLMGACATDPRNLTSNVALDLSGYAGTGQHAPRLPHASASSHPHRPAGQSGAFGANPA